MSKEIPVDEKFTNEELDEFTVEELKELFTDYEMDIPKGNKPELLAEAKIHFSSEYVQEDEGNGEENEPVEGDTLEEPQSEPKKPTIDINQLTNVEVNKAPQATTDGIRKMEDLRGKFINPNEAAHYHNQQRVEELKKLKQ